MSRKSKAIFATAATVAMTSALLGATAATASADQPFTTGERLVYSCNYPLIGDNPLYVDATFQGPDSVASGGTVQAYDVTATAIVPADVVSLLYDLGGIDGVRGTADAQVTVDGGSPASVLVEDLVVPEQLVTDPTAEFPISAAQGPGTIVPPITAGAPGQLTAGIGDFAAVLDFHYYNTNPPSWQGPETVDCTLDPAANGAFSPSLTVS